MRISKPARLGSSHLRAVERLELLRDQVARLQLRDLLFRERRIQPGCLLQRVASVLDPLIPLIANRAQGGGALGVDRTYVQVSWRIVGVAIPLEGLSSTPCRAVDDERGLVARLVAVGVVDAQPEFVGCHVERAAVDRNSEAMAHGRAEFTASMFCASITMMLFAILPDGAALKRPV